jgi:predicted GNAT family acetyltransferase
MVLYGQLAMSAFANPSAARSIGGVATHPDYRERGFAKQVISAVSRDYLAKNKHVILFCKNDNVPALAVYEKLGFRPIDQFIVAKF